MATQSRRATLREFWGDFRDYKILEEKRESLPPGVLMRVGGIFQAEDEKNRNKRIYPTQVWDEVFQDQEWQECMKGRGLLSELDHPDDGGRLRRTSHIVTHLERRDIKGKKVLYGEADILDTPDGQVAATLFKAGARVGVSSRGEGSVQYEKERDADVVQNDFRPEAFDFVTKPSTFVQGLGGAFPEVLSEDETNRFDVALTSVTKLLSESQDPAVQTACLRFLENAKLKTTERPTNKPKSRKEDSSMTAMRKKQGDKQQAFNELKEMARDMAAKEVDKIKSLHMTEKQKLQNDLTHQLRDLNETKKRLNAAERIIEAYDTKVRQEMARRSKPSRASRRTEAELGAAKKIIETAVTMLRKQRHIKRYAEAAEQVAQALLDRSREEKVRAYVRESLVGVKDKSKRESVINLMKGVRTVKEAKERLQALNKLAESTGTRTFVREPLPGDRIDRSSPSKPKRQGSFTARLHERVAGRK